MSTMSTSHQNQSPSWEDAPPEPPAWLINGPPIEEPHHHNGFVKQTGSEPLLPTLQTEPALTGFELNDAGNADAFLARHHNAYRHVEEWGWLRYEGTHWQKKGARKEAFDELKEILRERIALADSEFERRIDELEDQFRDVDKDVNTETNIEVEYTAKYTEYIEKTNEFINKAKAETNEEQADILEAKAKVFKAKAKQEHAKTKAKAEKRHAKAKAKAEKEHTKAKAKVETEAKERRKSVKIACKPSTRNINAAITQLEHSMIINAYSEEFDSHKFLLNVRNGVVDVRTGEFMKHDPGFNFTTCASTNYYPDANTTGITDLLASLGLSDAVISYLQRSAGYTLTGSTREECMFYIWGPTRSGKGTFMTALRTLLGNVLSAEIKFEVLTSSKRGDTDAQNFALAPLKPCRLLVASESGKYSSLNEAKVKQLTGGDSIHCAFKGKTHFNYQPQFKIWLTSNHPPKGDVDDDAFWLSRLRVIEFPKSFLGKEDTGLKARVQSLEFQEGLLAWAIEGAMQWWKDERLIIPDEVVESTARARAELDHIQQWLDECTKTREETYYETNQDLYQSYEKWCEDNGVPAKKNRAFGQSMTKKGFERHRKRLGGKKLVAIRYGLQLRKEGNEEGNDEWSI